MHVHVHSPNGEAKFWIEPKIELATSFGMPRQQIKVALTLVQEHENEIRSAWNTHFGS